jgi:hypothetical protein
VVDLSRYMAMPRTDLEINWKPHIARKFV